MPKAGRAAAKVRNKQAQKPASRKRAASGNSKKVSGKEASSANFVPGRELLEPRLKRHRVDDAKKNAHDVPSLSLDEVKEEEEYVDLTFTQCLNALAAHCTSLTANPQENLTALRSIVEICELGANGPRDRERKKIVRAFERVKAHKERKAFIKEQKKIERIQRQSVKGGAEDKSSGEDDSSDNSNSDAVSDDGSEEQDDHGIDEDDDEDDDDEDDDSEVSRLSSSDSDDDGASAGMRRKKNGKKNKDTAANNARRRRRRRRESTEKLAAALSQLHPVVASFSSLKPHEQAELRRLALLSGCAVFQDILPAYRIRVLTPEELKVQHSKAVRIQWDFEQGLLAGYKSYLQAAEQTLRQSGVLRASGKTGAATDKTGLVLAEVASKCYCELLSRHSSFNFSTNIINVLAPLCAGLKTPQRIAESVCRCFAGIFNSDTTQDVSSRSATTGGDGSVAVIIVKQLADIVKDKMRFTRPLVLDTFLALNLTEDLYETDIFESKRNKKKDATKKQEKRREKRKTDHQLELDMREAEARSLTHDRKKNQTEIVKLVMLSYFRVLRHGPSDDGGIGEEAEESTLRRLLPAVLRGLAKFSYLINVELVTDVCNIFRALMQEQHQLVLASHATELIDNAEAAASAVLPIRLRLHCIATVFSVLRKHDPLTVDRKDFFGYLFNLLPDSLSEGLDVAHRGGAVSDDDFIVEPDACELAVACLEAATAAGGFGGRKGIANAGAGRAAAFVKRFFSIATYWPPHAIMGGLAWVQQMLQLHPELEQLFAHERDATIRGGAGLAGVTLGVPTQRTAREFDELPVHMFADVEHADGLKSALWEGAALFVHWHPDVRNVVTRMFRTPKLHYDQVERGGSARAQAQIGGLTQSVTFDDPFLAGKTPTQHTTHYRVCRSGDFQPIPKGVQAEIQRQQQARAQGEDLSKRQLAQMTMLTSDVPFYDDGLRAHKQRAEERPIDQIIAAKSFDKLQKEMLQNELMDVQSQLLVHARYQNWRSQTRE